jgi:hypothetical protein
MANAETEEDDLSLTHPNRIMGKKPSKKIIFNGANANSAITVKETKSNNFFKESIVSPALQNSSHHFNQRHMPK